MPQNGGPDPEPVATTQRSTPVALAHHYMEPRSFAGRAGEDVDEWLTHYNRVSRYNHWNSLTKLDNVVLFLRETALMWFENHEESLTTWELFVEEIGKCFGDTDAKKKRAERTLAQRAQTPTETCTTYIEEVLKLCKIINPRMSEDDRVGHLLKGIAEDVYNFLIGREDLTSVSDVLRHCRTFETLKTRRIAPKFGRLANVTTVASVDTSPSTDLASTIREIVREELRRHNELVCNTAQPPATYPVYHSAPTAPCATLPPSVCVTDVDVAGTAWPHLETFPSEQRYGQRFHSSRDAQRRTAPVQRTGVLYPVRQPLPAERLERYFVERPLPLCYNCGIEGHIARYCNVAPQRRQPPRYDRSTTSGQQRVGGASTYPRGMSNENLGTLRNRSPASDRSLTPPSAPRVSRSPSPWRRYPSPSPEN